MKTDIGIEFGTAGLRGRMEAGFNRMNDVTVLQASQGLAIYVEQSVENALQRGIVIGHDHRHNSLRFAQLTALAFVQRGYRVYYFKRNVHTPMVPFGVDSLKAACGVMITASHNPAADNGYKVYWSNGCQIIPPHDSGISQAIEANLTPWSWDVSILDSSPKVFDPVENLETKYFESISENLLTDHSLQPLSFVYTPIHGVGLHAISRLLKIMGVESNPRSDNTPSNFSSKVLIVSSQAQPDPDFPTVAFPNPEEKGALDLAITHAEQNDISVVLANDPDADRFSAAVKTPDSGQWKQLSGNQLGVLFAQYILDEYKASHNGDVSKLAFVSSTVSSGLLAIMAKANSFKYVETLTGFKWIGNMVIDLEHRGYQVPFAYEEAIGFMFSGVHDKDGIAAATIFIQMMSKWTVESTNAFEQLSKIYQTYGYFREYNSYYTTPDASVTDTVFNDIRNQFPSKSNIGTFIISYWRDLTTGYDSSTTDNKPLLPVSPNSQMITFELQPKLKSQSGLQSKQFIRVHARGSGTEPKLKVYIEACDRTEEAAEALAIEVWNLLKEEWFKPEIYGLKVA